jgi:hypothetical protein
LRSKGGGVVAGKSHTVSAVVTGPGRRPDGLARRQTDQLSYRVRPSGLTEPSGSLRQATGESQSDSAGSLRHEPRNQVMVTVGSRLVAVPSTESTECRRVPRASDSNWAVLPIAARLLLEPNTRREGCYIHKLVCSSSNLRRNTRVALVAVSMFSDKRFRTQLRYFHCNNCFRSFSVYFFPVAARPSDDATVLKRSLGPGAVTLADTVFQSLTHSAF